MPLVPQFVGSLAKYPARVSFVWYAVTLAVGAVLLWQPFCHAHGAAPFSLLDCFFTAASALCVTGLTVRSTGHDLSLAGQAVVLVLMQVGGIGILTVTTFATFGVLGRGSLRSRAVLAETLGAGPNTNIGSLLRNVIAISLLVEAAGFVILLIRNLFDLSLSQAAWHALFHSVSAYCNAGFSLHDDSLTRFQADPFVNLTICTLIVVGGIGFPVLLDIKRNWRGTWLEMWDRLHLHTKVMLIGTTGLLTLGTILFLILEWANALEKMPLWQKLMVALFQSVTCRTAGFNTVPIGSLTNATLFIMMVLMMIGGGPCSTAGGFKVSTAMALVTRSWMSFRGYHRLNVFRRTVPEHVVERATATALLFAVVAMLALVFILMLEQSELPHTQSPAVFLDSVFEVVSALGTVGLSTGLTGALTSASRVAVIILMFLGRLGPITVFVALTVHERDQRLEFPVEEPLIG